LASAVSCPRPFLAWLNVGVAMPNQTHINAIYVALDWVFVGNPATIGRLTPHKNSIIDSHAAAALTAASEAAVERQYTMISSQRHGTGQIR